MAGLQNPFLRGQLAAAENIRRGDETEVTGLARLLNMQQSVAEQPLKMDLLRAQVADVQAKPGDRILARQVQQEATMARLNQAAQQFEQNYQLRLRGVTTQEERLALERQREAFKQQLQGEAARLAGARGAYDFGFMPGSPVTPTVAPSAPATPPSGLEALLVGRPEAERIAITSAANGQPANVGPYRAPASPVPTAPAVAPVNGSPVDVPSFAPDTHASLSMQHTGGLEGRFPPRGGLQPVAGPLPTPSVQTAGPAIPAVAPGPQVPAFTSPRARDQWLAKNSPGSGTLKLTGREDAPGDYTKTGDAFLETIPLNERNLVKKVASYDIDPKTLSVVGGNRERVLKMASQYDPNFDQKNYNTTAAAINRFATGQQGNTVRSLNVAIEHMDTARRLGDALKNSDLPLFNRVANEFATQTGKPAPTSFEAVKEIVADEVVKGVIGGAGALADREAAARKIRAASSPAQMNAVFDSWTELLGGQLKGLERQYEGATRRKDFRERYITPRALEAIDKTGHSSPTPPAIRASDQDLINKYLNR